MVSLKTDTPIRPATDGGSPARDDRQVAGKGKTAKREEVMPKALRDRMRGLVESEN